MSSKKNSITVFAQQQEVKLVQKQRQCTDSTSFCRSANFFLSEEHCTAEKGIVGKGSVRFRFWVQAIVV